MKTFTFRYDPDASLNDLFSRAIRAAKSKTPDVHPNVLASKSVSSLLQAMSAGRIELFYAIASKRPDSIYHLAQLIERDSANVIRDVKTLEQIGLIELVPEKDGDRERLRPVAKYDRIVFDFGASKRFSKKDPDRKKTAV